MPLSSAGLPLTDDGAALQVDTRPSDTIIIDDGEGSITVDGGVSVTGGRIDAIQSGEWSTVPLRPSQKEGRTYIDGALGDQKIGQTVYTVTQGKTLYVTTVNISAVNSGVAASGYIQIRDGNTLKIPVTVPTAGLGALASLIPLNVSSFSFEEPKKFTTNFNVNIASGTMTYSIDFTGYEE